MYIEKLELNHFNGVLWGDRTHALYVYPHLIKKKSVKLASLASILVTGNLWVIHSGLKSEKSAI